MNRFERIRPSAAAVLLVLACSAAAPAIAPTALAPEEARRQTEAARRALDMAEQKFADARARADRADADLKLLLRKQTDLADDYRRSMTLVETTRQKMTTAETSLPEVQRQADTASREAAERRATLDDAKTRSVAVAAEIRKANEALTAEFRASEPYLRAESDIVEKQNRLDEAKGRRLKEIEKDAAYQSAKKVADGAEAVVNAERSKSPGDPSALTAASGTWIDAKGKLEAVKNEAFEKDPDVRTAAEALKAARAARDVLQSDFEKNLPSHPRLVEPTEKLRQAKLEVSQLTGVVDRAEKNATKLSRSVDAIQATIVGAKADLTTAQARSDNLRSQTQLMPTTIKQFTIKLRALRDEEATCRAARDVAAKTLKDMMLQEQQAISAAKNKAK